MLFSLWHIVPHRNTGNTTLHSLFSLSGSPDNHYPTGYVSWYESKETYFFFFLVWKTEVKQGDWHKPSTGLLPRWQLLLRVMCGCRGPSSWAIFHCFLRSEVPKFKWMSVWDTGAVSGSVIHCMSPFSLCTNKIKSSKPNLRGMLNYLCSHSKF